MTEPLDDPGRKRRLRTVWLVSSLIYVGFMLALGSAWYSTQWISSFHFFDDLPEWKQMDKVAHLFWTFHASAMAARLLMWATGDTIRSNRGGALMGFMFVSGIEIFDGFSIAYGASLWDIGANAIGASLFFLQQHFWKRILVWPKFSFHPTTFAPLRPDVLGNGFLPEVLKDYNGQTFWYGVRLPWLPLPKWLVLAVGVRAEGMIFGRMPENEAVGLDPQRRYYLSLDVDLRHIKTDSHILRILLYIPNIIKVPAPAIEFSASGIRFHPLYF